MKFIIKPHDTSLDLLLEAVAYQQLWKIHGRPILKAFREVTGLDFQQTMIVARVFKGKQSVAGSPYHPMLLAGDNRSDEFKLITIVHELSHRLLGGNALGIVNLGLSNEHVPSPRHDEFDHRHTYLFEFDVVQRALGNDWAAQCQKFEERGASDSPHDLAWRWAMGLTYDERQRALKILTAKAMPRERWHELKGKTIEPINAEHWFKMLKTARP